MSQTAQRIVGVACAMATLAAACTGGDGSAPETIVPAPTTTTTPQRSSDGQLTIGLLLPSSDPVMGQGLIKAANTAVERINEAGGVIGRPVRIVEQSEGLGDGGAAGVAALLASNPQIDAVVGPASSLTALNELDTLVSAGVMSCSPTATALALDDFPDNGLFFRTAPSDSLQALAIADLAQRTGVQNIAVAHVDDVYGRPFAEAVSDALSEGTRTVTTYPFVRGDGIEGVAQDLVESGARVVVVLAGNDDGTAFLEALSRTNFGSLIDVIVNDQFRDPAGAQRIETLDPSLRDRIRGVAPQAQSADEDRPFDPPGLFAANAFDCVNLIALAVDLVGTDDPSVFSAQIPALTTRGRVCRSFDECKSLLDESLNINYNGPDGITELLVVGHPARARFDVFAFDETGRGVFEQSIVASRL
ncbi:MAG: ABC transporter substrate-binding protein [Actinomycetota bacterium]|jgi:branched-chain amino acid transport system substrate-binding protein|uniref:ABC transporter substrate-binding protein n=1 Tax=uncultured Ilumatobacter sp. TaxID=879968 RepID=UPI00374EF64A|nr:ABC transporter substrate-binding protein [Actinomycetota bacterium]